jgi:hypothetical protein
VRARSKLCSYSRVHVYIIDAPLLQYILQIGHVELLSHYGR